MAPIYPFPRAWKHPDSRQYPADDERPASEIEINHSGERSQNGKDDGLGAASPATDSDHALIAACCAGNKQAFDILILRHQEFVSTLATRLLRDPHEAKELTQETFLRAYEEIAEFRGETQFSTWLSRLCYNLCLTRLRRKADEITNSTKAGPLAHTLPDPSSRLPNQLMLTRQRQKLRQALTHITPEFREVLRLHYRVHLSYAEIATRLRLPVGTVRSRLHRGREELRKRLRSYLREE